MATTKKELIIDGNQAVCYEFRYKYSLEIELPFSNCMNLVDYLEKSFDTGKPNVNGQVQTRLKGKFDIYITDDHLKKLDSSLAKIPAEHSTDLKDLKSQIRTFHTAGGQYLYRMKMCFSMYDYCIFKKQDSDRSLRISIKKILVYQINNKYYINLLPDTFRYIDMDLSLLSIDPACLVDYQPYVCELDKIKEGYRPYITKLKNQIKNREVKFTL